MKKKVKRISWETKDEQNISFSLCLFSFEILHFSCENFFPFPGYFQIYLISWHFLYKSPFPTTIPINSDWRLMKVPYTFFLDWFDQKVFPENWLKFRKTSMTSFEDQISNRSPFIFFSIELTLRNRFQKFRKEVHQWNSAACPHRFERWLKISPQINNLGLRLNRRDWATRHIQVVELNYFSLWILEGLFSFSSLQNLLATRSRTWLGSFRKWKHSVEQNLKIRIFYFQRMKKKDLVLFFSFQ